jgi:hypothetical protein
MMFTTLLGVAVTIGAGWAETPSAWHSDYAAAHAEARKADKPLFIMICPGASEYAQMIGLGTFLNERIEGSLRTDYVRVVIDSTTPEGQATAKQFGVEQGPYFAIIDRSGKWQVFYQAGILLEDDLTPVLAKHRRSKLNSQGRPVVEVAQRQTIRLCST